jgi:transcription elongation factor GreA-like protein
MNGKLNLRIGDVVYHRTINLGRGKIRYIYRKELLVDFEKAFARRYPREEICKSPLHLAGDTCACCGYGNPSAA